LGRYGPAPKNSDSAINVLLDAVQDQSGKQYKMDHYATRFPTNVVDIARFLIRLSDVSGMSFSDFCLYWASNVYVWPGQKKVLLPPIIHYSTAEPFTKCMASLSSTFPALLITNSATDEICLIFSQILSLSNTHIIPDAEAPTGSGATTRPRNCQLYTRETEALLPDGDLGCCGFEEWWREHLGK
jgi:S-adenosylmethionine synthetase